MRSIMAGMLVAGLLGGTAGLLPAQDRATAEAAAETVARSLAPRVDVVFVLDTTGSMSGLIQGAKDTIWRIANQLATLESTPDIRMGLVGYRDRGDQYITVHTPLTDDLDAVYTDLTAYQAAGGGDGPESVNQALHEAVSNFDWRTDPDTYRVIFLVGDAPPHMDYPDDVKYPETCQAAARAGITINAIQCGTNAGAQQPWTDIARLAEGKYFRIEQSGGVEVVNTPFDEELARLGAELDGTLLYYGEMEVQSAMRERKSEVAGVVARAAPAAAADRIAFNTSASGMKNFLGRQELLNDLAEETVTLEDLPANELPTELQGRTIEEQQAIIAEKREERDRLMERIDELNGKRAGYLKEARENREATTEESAFDTAVMAAINEQAAR